jgi:transcriptional regulator with XRE-family HTH domain
MNGKTFKKIRTMMKLTQKEMGGALGYAQKIRISEYERGTNPVPIPRDIGNKALLMGEDWWDLTHGRHHAVREWKRRVLR